MKYTLKDFVPLIVLFAIITSFTLLRGWYSGFNISTLMSDFMGAFFIVFGFFKVINIKGFVTAYQMYDVLAKRSLVYAYAYPFIELTLGVAYLLRLWPTITNLITFLIMSVSAIGVAQELAQKKEIVCACLGAVFKIPMTYVTLLEDVVMAGMALAMLFI